MGIHSRCFRCTLQYRSHCEVYIYDIWDHTMLSLGPRLKPLNQCRLPCNILEVMCPLDNLVWEWEYALSVPLGSDEGKVYGSLITSAKRTGPESESHTERRKRKQGMCIFWCILEGNSFISIVYQTHSQTKECRTGNWTTVILGTCIRQGIIDTGMLEPVWLVRPWPNHFWPSFNGILCSRPAIHILIAGNNFYQNPSWWLKIMSYFVVFFPPYFAWFLTCFAASDIVANDCSTSNLKASTSCLDTECSLLIGQSYVMWKK